MKRMMKWALWAIAIVVLVGGAAAFWKREEIARLMTVNSLFAEDRIVGNFSNMDSAFLTVEVPRGEGPVSNLPIGEALELPEDVGTWIKDRNMTSLVVLHDGMLVHESYYLGTGPDDRRMSWSTAKSYLSTLLGTLVEDGTISDLGVSVTEYAPELAGSVYDGVFIRDVLQMSSGVTFNEDYLDYDSDINRMGRAIALGGSLDDLTLALEGRDRPAGEAWQYVSVDTHVIAMVIRGATGLEIPALLSERVIAPLGLEETPYYVTDGVGQPFTLGGLNMRTRDFARFGQMMVQGGTYNGHQIVSADWIAEATAPSAPTAENKIGYGYQWWVPKGSEPGQFLARGIYGQYIYIDQTRGVVVAATGADRGFREEGVADESIRVLRLIAERF